MQERMDGIESKHRNRPVEESLEVWKEMLAGSPVGVANCMRFKISMSDLNKAMRDPVAYRCNLIPHIRTGTKYKVRHAQLILLCMQSVVTILQWAWLHKYTFHPMNNLEKSLEE